MRIVMAVVAIVGLSLLLMPALVQAPRPIEQPPPGSDPALPH